jgi:ribosomal protein S18 acetylase RimI-like enzyme
MPVLTVRVLAEEDWPVFRVVHLASLQDSPSVFGDTHDQESAADEMFWRSQLTWARRVVAELDGHLCGVVSVVSFSDEPEAAELFGLWVDPTARSTGVAGRLVDTAAALAAADGLNQLYYWAGSENGRAIGFAIGFGFRVTSLRRPSGSGDPSLGDSEIALVLPLDDDPSTVPNAATSKTLRR